MRKEEEKESWRGEGKLKRWWSVMKKGVSPRVPNSVFIDPKDGSELPGGVLRKDQSGAPAVSSLP